MRYTLWFTVGFATACAIFAYLLSSKIILGVGLILLGMAIACLCIFKEESPKRIAAIICLGAAMGFLWCSGLYAFRLDSVRRLDGCDRTLTVTVTDYHSKETTQSYVPSKTQIDGKNYKVLVYLYDGLDLKPGYKITGNFYLKYTATGADKSPTHHRGEGYFLLLHPNDECKVTPGDLQWRYLPAEIRQKFMRIIDSTFPSDTAAFAKALLLGRTEDLTYEADTAMKISGIRHVVAVSGLHVSILYSLVYLLSVHKRKLAAILGIPLLFLFAAVAGFSPSIVRACVMQLVMMVGQLFEKEQDPPTSLSIAVLLLLTINPLSVTSVGFQLSAASVAGIFTLYQRISDRLTDSVWTELCNGKPVAGMVAKYVIGSVSVSLSASLFTLPLCAYYFGTVSLISIVTNLLCMWSITFLFCGIIAVCLLGLFCMPVATGAGWLLSWLIRGILFLAGGLSKMPLSAVYMQNPGVVIWLIVTYAFLIAFLMRKWFLPGNPIWYSAILLLCVILCTRLQPMTEEYRLTVLDVGQGQCVVLQSEERTVMIDCGGDYDEIAADTAASYLLNLGIRKLDGLIITHYDRDHVGGVRHLMRRIFVESLYLPDASDGNDIRNTLENIPHGTTVTVDADLLLSWPNTEVRIFAPEPGKTGNESSLCVLFQRENCDILITGDMDQLGELELIHRCSLPDLEYLIAGHHGAATSTGLPLLQTTLPDTVLISAGADNRYGHPSDELLQRLNIMGIAVRRTDLEGTIMIRG